VANPSYTRIDTWNLLDDACRHLVAVHRAGLDTRQKVARARRLIDRLAAYERYWLYPGAANLEAFRGYLADLATERLADEVSLAVRLLSEYGDRAALFDMAAPLADQELVARARQHQFYTVLLAEIPRPRLPKAWRRACGHCAHRRTTCSSNCWSCPALRTPSPRSR
jgi:arginine decarboxylase